MKYFASLLVLASIILAGCSDSESVTYIGKTLEYQYGESIYHVTFDSDSEMHWEAVAGDETGAKEFETYKAEWIDSQKLFITWGEANGIGVSQILDFENGIVYNHLLRDRDVSIGMGEIRFLD
ncbi:MoaF-related domain-containing protein [Algoriphagus zhangzhouensis]|uniref:MoaF-like domain-containing protein n=1 Tax=Algoriphagus zhangzhouensis TaxID=1073327 RepID=A0A1M7Z561_9BACT|nr:hypothetical protein [Algoriphagus zhangzhouensis]TDY48826.1 hypothetical protein A8938_0515 [Algoriphagus zhangzhouensis]SHO60015.1 hypothetical protein SAMN04488108_0515 [Algoriphagus zhangzhouensis]